MLFLPSLLVTNFWCNKFFKPFLFFILINFINPKNIPIMFNPEFCNFFKNIKYAQTSQKINKNFRKIFRKIRQRKNLFTINYRTGFIKLKFLNFFQLNQKKNHKNLIKISPQHIKHHNITLHFFFFFYRSLFFQRWFPLTGLAMSVKNKFNLRDKKRWLKKNIRFKIRRNYKFYKRTYRLSWLKAKTLKLQKKKKKKIKLGALVCNKLIEKHLKTIYYDNMFYFLRIKVAYRRLRFFLRLIRFKFSPNTRRNVYHESYLFLNNKATYFKKALFPLKRILKLYKLHRRLFKTLKRRNYWTKKWIHIWFKAYSNVKFRKNKQLVTFNFKLNIKQRLRNFFNIKLVPIKKIKKIRITTYLLTCFFLKKKFTRFKNNLRIKWRKFFIGYFFRGLRKKVLYRKFKKLLTKFSHSKVFLKKRKIPSQYISSTALRSIRRIFKQRRNRRWYSWRLTRKFRRWCFWIFLNKTVKFPKFNITCYHRYKFIKIDKFNITKKLSSFKKYKNLNRLFWFRALKKKPLRLFNFLNCLNFPTRSIVLKFVRPVIIKSVVYARFKKPILTPVHFSNFILRTVGFLLLTNTLFLNYSNKNKQRVFLIKKKLYSFSYKNDMRKHLLKRSSKWRRLTLLTKYFRRNRKLAWKKFYNPGYRELKLSTKTLNLKFDTPVSNLRSLLSRRFSSKNSLDVSQYTKRKKLGKRRFRLKLPLIKFKAISTWWRRSRQSLLQSLNLKFRYQHRLTKFIINYKKILKKNFLIVFEMRLFNILTRTRLILDQITIIKFIENRLVFVNGVCCENRDLQIFTNDFIQLVVTFKYYVAFRWLLNYSLKMKKRIKRFYWKNKQRKHRMDKQWSYRLQRTVLPHKHLVLDVAKYLEVDFFTLSAFVLYDPFLWSDLDRYHILNVRYGIFNVYNWKYIT